MTLEQLRIFLAVAEQLHFTRAADMLYLTQPAVSAAIQNLETEHGIKLFHRIGRRVELTDAGRLLQVEAEKILKQVELTARGLRELNDLQRGELKLGSSLTIGNYWLPDKISQFKRQYPGISVECSLRNAEEICEGTASGLYDLGIIAGAVKPSLRQQLNQEVVGQERIQIVVGQAHPWFERSSITLEELRTAAWVMREPGSGAQRAFEQALLQWDIDPEDLNVVLVFTSSEMVKAVVEDGVGVGAIPELMVAKELRLGTLRSLEVVAAKAKPKAKLEIIQPVFKLKHRRRFQTRISIAFEEILTRKSVVVGS